MTPREKRGLRVRLQVGVTVTFAVFMLLVVGVTIGFFYDINGTLALETAERAMRDAETNAEATLMGLLEPVGRVLAATASFLAAVPAEVRTPEGMPSSKITVPL